MTFFLKKKIKAALSFRAFKCHLFFITVYYILNVFSFLFQYNDVSYDFSWSVKDDYTGNDYGHSENRKGYDTSGEQNRKQICVQYRTCNSTVLGKHIFDVFLAKIFAKHNEVTLFFLMRPVYFSF